MKKIASELGETKELISIISKHLGESCGTLRTGVLDNVTPYGILSPERSDETEGVVFMAPYLTAAGTINLCGIAYVLAAAKQYKKYKFWSRNFVILFPGIGKESNAKVFSAVEDWLAAYHKLKPGMSLSSGALQTGLSIELEGEQCSMPFGDPEVYLEGPDGLLPNLDAVNSLVMIERHRGGNLRLFPKRSFWYRLWSRLQNPYFQGIVYAVSMLVRQATGFPLFSHGPMLKYRIDILTINFRQMAREESSEYVHRNLFEYLKVSFYSFS
jgi:hypothetical protein